MAETFVKLAMPPPMIKIFPKIRHISKERVQKMLSGRLRLNVLKFLIVWQKYSNNHKFHINWCWEIHCFQRCKPAICKFTTNDLLLHSKVLLRNFDKNRGVCCLQGLSHENKKALSLFYHKKYFWKKWMKNFYQTYFLW